MGSLIEARALHVRYRRSHDGLDGVDLAVAPGEIVAVLGPNGAGKSTLVRALAGDLRATAGTVRLASVPVGYAPDEAVHADALSGRLNATLFADANGGAAAVAAVPGLLAAFGLVADAERPAGELSFGGRRKLMIVQALAHRPGVLLLDEPTVGLDPDAVAALFRHMHGIAGQGGAVVFASNDVRTAEAIATRIVFLRAGRKIADDSPRALLRAAGGSTRIEIDGVDPGPNVAFPDGVHVTAVSGGWVLSTASGTEVLPAVCAALGNAGARIAAIRVHEVDLADAFRVLTGEAWRPTSREPS